VARANAFPILVLVMRTGSKLLIAAQGQATSYWTVI